MRDNIPNALHGERLDRVIAIMTGLSRSAVSALIKSNQVLRNGQIAQSISEKVVEGDELEVHLERGDSDIASLDGDSEVLFRIVYSDEDIVVIDKPVGLVVHPGAGNNQSTLANGLIHHFPEMAAVGPINRPGIVHRLDKDTTGLLVCARTQEALETLTVALGEREIERVYLTIVAGRPDAPKGTIDAPIGRSRRARTRMTISEEGREARTHYELLESWANPKEASLLRCKLESGRTHQIRVHLRAINTPVLGDSIYGKPDPFGIGRPLLHAAELSFQHPVSKKNMSFLAPMPPDFEMAVDTFRARNI